MSVPTSFIPADISLDGSALLVKWADLRNKPLLEPHFSQSLAAIRTGPDDQELQTGLDVLAAAAREGLRPSGFIFHGSRTGSTLVSRILQSDPRCLVLSNPTVVNQLLGLQQSLPQRDRIAAIRNLIFALGRPRRPTETIYVVRFASMCSLSLHFFRAAFPEVPWVFLIREPREAVMAALMRPTSYMLSRVRRPESAQHWLKPVTTDGADESDKTLVARVLASFYLHALAAVRQDPRLSLVVDYSYLPDAVEKAIGPHFGAEFNEPDSISRGTQLSNVKQLASIPTHEITPEVDALCKEWVDPAYNALLAIASKRSAPPIPGSP